jgi:YD repeat-containing protein
LLQLREEEITLNGSVLVRTYNHDVRGNLTEQIDRDGRRIGCTCDTLNRRTKETWYDPPPYGAPTGYVAEYTYYADGSLAGAADWYATGQNSAYGFTYDTQGHPDQVTQVQPHRSGSLVYDHDFDAGGRLTQRRVVQDGDSTPWITTTYAYDALDRLELVTQSGSQAKPVSVDYVYLPFSGPHAGGTTATIAWNS